MNNEDLIEVVINDFKLLFPLCVAIEHLTEQVVDNEILDEFNDNTICLIENISQNHTDVEDKSKNLINSILSLSTNLKEDFSIWLNLVLNDLFDAILELKQSNYFFKHEQIQTIIEFIIGTRYDNEETFKDFFDILISKGNIIPMETFGIGMYILERYGYISANPQLHPNYLYSKSNDMQHEFNACPICAGMGQPFLTAYSFQYEKFDNPNLPLKLWMKCTNCGSCYTRYTSSYIFNYITPNNLLTPITETIKSDLISTNSNILCHYGDILKKISNVYNLDNSKNLLAVCSSELIAVALELGYNADVVDYNQENAQLKSNLLQMPVNNCNLIDFDTDKKYSVIVLQDFIEQSFNTVNILNKLNELLLDDGVIWLSTPNFDSAFTRLQKEKSSIWFKPEYINLFSKKSIESILNYCGFKIVDYSISKTDDSFMELLVQKK